MMEIAKRITENGSGRRGECSAIIGQAHCPEAVCNASFAFRTSSEPGQVVPVYVFPDHEFILAQEGEVDLKLDGERANAHAGDLVRMPRAILHGHFSRSRRPCRSALRVSALRVSAAGRLGELCNEPDRREDTGRADAVSRARRRLPAGRGKRMTDAQPPRFPDPGRGNRAPCGSAGRSAGALDGTAPDRAGIRPKARADRAGTAVPADKRAEGT